MNYELRVLQAVEILLQQFKKLSACCYTGWQTLYFISILFHWTL